MLAAARLAAIILLSSHIHFGSKLLAHSYRILRKTLFIHVRIEFLRRRPAGTLFYL